jgi:hypothetical protein
MDSVQDDDELEPVERRTTPRGRLHGLVVRLSLGGAPAAEHEVLEASDTGFFVAADAPARFAPGTPVGVEIRRAALTLALQGEVARIETEPRHGFAVRLVDLDAADRAAWLRLIGR